MTQAPLRDTAVFVSGHDTLGAPFWLRLALGASRRGPRCAVVSQWGGSRVGKRNTTSAAFVPGHDFTTCGKDPINDRFCVRARVYSCRKASKINRALAPEDFFTVSVTFVRKLFSRAVKPHNNSRLQILSVFPKTEEALR